MKHRSRLERAEQLGVAAAAAAAGQTQRQVAAGLGVARSTLRGWRAAEPLDGMPAEVAACLSTPGGARWLHRLVVAMHLVVTLRAGAGVRLVCELLTLSGLSAVVGASYGSQYAVNVQVQEAVVGQAQELRAALAVDMPPREVAVCVGKRGQILRYPHESRPCLRLGEERRMVAGDPLVDLHNGSH